MEISKLSLETMSRLCFLCILYQECTSRLCQEYQRAWLDVAQWLFLQLLVRQVPWIRAPINFMSDCFVLLISASHLNQTSQLNESANHLAKNCRKKTPKKISTKITDIQFLTSRDKNFILILTCFGIIFTRSLTLLSLQFFSHYSSCFSLQRQSRI